MILTPGRFLSFAVGIVLLLLALGISTFAEVRAQGMGPGNIEAVYGKDDRVDWGDIHDKDVKKVARASAAIFHRKWIVRHGEFSVQKHPSLPVHGARKQCLGDGRCLPLCPGNPFMKQRGGAQCSATLITPDTLVTAGHCFSDLNESGGVPFAEAVFVFGHYAKDANHAGEHRFSFRQVFKGAELVGGVLTLRQSLKRVTSGRVEKIQTETKRENYEDWAIVKLDRPVPKEIAEPVKVRLARIADKANVFAIGYPNGLPLKYAPGAQVETNTPEKYFVASLDTFQGNSGSGVFLEDTKELIGILVRGSDDYFANELKGCASTNYCRRETCSGEEVNRIGAVLK